MKKKILGMSDAWLTIHLSHRPSEPAYYIVGFQARVRPARASAIEPLFSDCSLETRRPPPPLGAAIFSALGREEETIQRWYVCTNSPKSCTRMAALLLNVLLQTDVVTKQGCSFVAAAAAAMRIEGKKAGSLAS